MTGLRIPGSRVESYSYQALTESKYFSFFDLKYSHSQEQYNINKAKAYQSIVHLDGVSSQNHSAYNQDNLPSLGSIKSLPADDKLSLIKNMKVNEYGPASHSKSLHVYMGKRHMSKQQLSLRRTKLAAMVTLPKEMYC